ncbi:Ste50p [Lipomyces oligophaga]|uniref:Ste50p n=1 Tax=Lipomyces oligophaga TaxID=45792 RepID=UPI0034CFB921
MAPLISVTRDSTQPLAGGGAGSGSKPSILTWDIKAVCSWLEELGLSQYQEAFVENEITGDVLVHLDHDFLKELDVQAVGHRLHILRAIYNIKMSEHIPIEPGQFVPVAVQEEGAANTGDRELVDVDRLMRSLELRDRRLLYAEQDIKRLSDNWSRLRDDYARLREDLLPIFKMVKESEPLPTPGTGQGPPHHQYHGPTRHSMFVPSSQPIDSNLSKTPSAFFSVKNNLVNANTSTSGVGSNNSSPTHQPNWIVDAPPMVPTQSSNTNNLSQTGTGSSTVSPTFYGHSPSPTGNTPQTAGLGSRRTSTMVAPTGSGTNTTSIVSMSNSPATVPPGFQLQQPPLSFASHRRRNSPPPMSTVQSTYAPSVAPTIHSPSSIGQQQTSSASNSGGSSLSLSEAIKRFRFKPDDPCYKVLPAVLKGHRINDDWRQYALLVCFGDQERVLGLDEKPLGVFKELQDQGQQPVFMLRAIQGYKHDQQGALVTGTPGGVL